MSIEYGLLFVIIRISFCKNMQSFLLKKSIFNDFRFRFERLRRASNVAKIPSRARVSSVVGIFANFITQPAVAIPTIQFNPSILYS